MMVLTITACSGCGGKKEKKPAPAPTKKVEVKASVTTKSLDIPSYRALSTEVEADEDIFAYSKEDIISAEKATELRKMLGCRIEKTSDGEGFKIVDSNNNYEIETFQGLNGNVIDCLHLGDTLIWYKNQVPVTAEYSDIQIFYDEKGNISDIYPRLNN